MNLTFRNYNDLVVKIFLFVLFMIKHPFLSSIPTKNIFTHALKAKNRTTEVLVHRLCMWWNLRVEKYMIFFNKTQTWMKKKISETLITDKGYSQYLFLFYWVLAQWNISNVYRFPCLSFHVISLKKCIRRDPLYIFSSSFLRLV